MGSHRWGAMVVAVLLVSTLVSGNAGAAPAPPHNMSAGSGDGAQGEAAGRRSGPESPMESARERPTESGATAGVETAGEGISGTVTESGSGAPVAGAWVAVLRTTDFSIAGGGVANASGNYSTEVPAGSYYLYVVDPTGAHTAGFHGPPTTVSVTSGAMTDADPQMVSLRGSIAGTVTEAGSGTPIGGAWVIGINATTGATQQGVVANGAGQYNIAGLRSGSYRPVFVDPTGAHASRYFPNSVDFLGATSLSVTAGASTAANVALPTQSTTPGAQTLSGTVREAGTNTALAGVFVVALRASDFRNAGGAVTNASGQYALNVAAGDYKLAFIDSTGLHNMEWHDNQPNTGLATATSVTAPAVTNAALDPNTGSLAGTITDDPSGTPITGAWVVAIGPTGAIAGGAVTAANGTYAITGLAPGTYRAAFLDPTGGRTLEYWDDHPDLISSDAINTTAGSTAAIDAALNKPSGGPTVVNPPVLSGPAVLGSTLTVSPGTWTGSAPISIAVRFESCSTDLTGCAPRTSESVNTYVVTASDIGRKVRAVVTATNPDGIASQFAISNVVTTPTPGPVVQHCGTLTANETWVNTRVHRTSCKVIVPAGITLTIAGGAAVQGASSSTIEVNGALDARSIVLDNPVITGSGSISISNSRITGRPAASGAAIYLGKESYCLSGVVNIVGSTLKDIEANVCTPAPTFRDNIFLSDVVVVATDASAAGGLSPNTGPVTGTLADSIISDTTSLTLSERLSSWRLYRVTVNGALSITGPGSVRVNGVRVGGALTVNGPHAVTLEGYGTTVLDTGRLTFDGSTHPLTITQNTTGLTGFIVQAPTTPSGGSLVMRSVTWANPYVNGDGSISVTDSTLTGRAPVNGVPVSTVGGWHSNTYPDRYCFGAGYSITRSTIRDVELASCSSSPVVNENTFQGGVEVIVTHASAAGGLSPNTGPVKASLAHSTITDTSIISGDTSGPDDFDQPWTLYQTNIEGDLTFGSGIHVNLRGVTVRQEAALQCDDGCVMDLDDHTLSVAGFLYMQPGSTLRLWDTGHVGVDGTGSATIGGSNSSPVVVTSLLDGTRLGTFSLAQTGDYENAFVVRPDASITTDQAWVGFADTPFVIETTGVTHDHAGDLSLAGLDFYATGTIVSYAPFWWAVAPCAYVNPLIIDFHAVDGSGISTDWLGLVESLAGTVVPSGMTPEQEGLFALALGNAESDARQYATNSIGLDTTVALGQNTVPVEVEACLVWASPPVVVPFPGFPVIPSFRSSRATEYEPGVPPA